MSNGEIAVERKPLTITEIRAQVNLIQEVMKSIMKKDEHYGIIPGCKKPSLYKPGAEKIASTFHIHIESEVEDLSTEDVSRFRVTCKAYSSQGVCLGSSVGVCSSDEEKYKWKRPVCDEEWEGTDPSKRREKWVKYGNEKAKQLKQIRTQPADLENTMLQMADKRGYVSIVRKVTAASDVFAMDIEDLPPEMVDEQDKRPPIKQPTAKKPEPTPPPEEKKLTAKESLIAELKEYTGNDEEKFKKFLKQFTAFGENKGTMDITKVSDKWAASALGKLRDKVKQEDPVFAECMSDEGITCRKYDKGCPIQHLEGARQQCEGGAFA